MCMPGGKWKQETEAHLSKIGDGSRAKEMPKKVIRKNLRRSQKMLNKCPWVRD